MKPDSAFVKQHPFVTLNFQRYSSRNRNCKIVKVGKYIEPKFAHKYYEENGGN
jgi:hypothetical protein